MLAFIAEILTGLVSLLTGVLPQSPFQGITLGEGIDTALGWLNWVFPVNECARIFGLWLAAALIVGVASFVIRKGTGVIGGITGAGGGD